MLAAATLTVVPLGGGSAGAAPVAPAAAPTATVANGCLLSVPDPGKTRPVKICYSLFRPAGATSEDRVPMVLHSHGWGGSRSRYVTDFEAFLDAGYGVLSFDQRGFGQSGGHAYVENPKTEGRDVRRVVALISRLPWVQLDAPGDPRLGSIGGSYGGGYQYLSAFQHLRTTGSPVVDAMAPQITWFDLKESLAPNGVVRSLWATILRAGSASSDALPSVLKTAFDEGAVTGEWPKGKAGRALDELFKRNGPKWHVERGRKLDIPVLIGQGTTDSLFPLEQALQTWQQGITPSARRQSIFVGYNGGHVLAANNPPGIDVTSDPCSEELAGGDFEALTIRFFDEQLKGEDTGLTGYGSYHLATPTSTCSDVSAVGPTRTRRIASIATRATGDAPTYVKLAAGPISLAGTSYLTGLLTSPGPEGRAFYGLAVGTSRATAHLVQNNLLPINEPRAVDRQRRRIDLPAVAIDVPAGQSLYLLAGPASDTFTGIRSATEGAIRLDDVVVHLPVRSR